jgi:hypothetical protein
VVLFCDFKLLHFRYLPSLSVFVLTLGNPVEMAGVNIEYRLPPRLQIEQLFQNLIALLPHLSVRNEDSTA